VPAAGAKGDTGRSGYSLVYASTTQSPVLLLGAAHVVDLEAPLRRELAARTLDGVAIERDQ
jgi:hypothetical protein